MRIIVLLNALKVGSLRTRQMLKVDLCANGAGAYAPYAPPLPTGLLTTAPTCGSVYLLVLGILVFVMYVLVACSYRRRERGETKRQQDYTEEYYNKYLRTRHR